MTLQAWGTAAVLVAASVLIGNALVALGAYCRTAGPAVGLSTLIVIAYAAIGLPGRANTAVVILLVVLAGAAALVVARWRAGRRGGSRASAERATAGGSAAMLVTIGLAAFGAAIPFIANGRVGLLGVSLDNDTAPHLIWAEALRSPIVGVRYGFSLGYPLGPHSLVAAIGTGLGARLDLAFTGLQIATVVLTAIVAAGALRGESAWKRPIVGVCAALIYMVAAYYAEGAFKEPLLGLLLLAMVLHLEEVGRDWEALAWRRWLALLPVSLLVAAAVYDYSYLAFAWIGITMAIWLAAEAVAHPRWFARWRARIFDLVFPAVMAAGLMLVLLAPAANRLISYIQSVGLSPAGTGAIPTSNLGNLVNPLSPYEALGIWQSHDFRFLPLNVFHQGEFAAFAFGVLVLGLAWSIARRELLLPAAVVTCALIYWRSSQGQSIYVTAKALVIAGPVVAVTGLRGLLRTPRAPLPRWLALGRWALAALFVGFAAHSSYQVLRNEPVWPAESTSELLALDKLTSGQMLLFLGNSDYAPWLFHDSEMSALAGTTISMAKAAPTAGRPYVYGTPLDFDTVDPSTINLFRWVITTNTTYASQPPPGFRLVRRLPMYELWQRIGQVPARRVLGPNSAPGAVLNCRSRSARALSRRRGIAAVMATPVVVSLATLQPSGSEKVPLRLPAGRWNLSLQYVSPVAVSLSAGGHRWRMPPYLDRPGPVFAVGSISSSGAPMTLTVRAQRPSFLTGPGLVALTTAVYATRSPDTRTLVPLRRSCGRYVDWFRLSS